jgi:tetratricopeptide (TPR) repeat protein
MNSIQAMNYATQTRKIREKLFGTRHPLIAQSIWLIALISKKLNNFNEAINLYQEAIDVIRERKRDIKHKHSQKKERKREATYSVQKDLVVFDFITDCQTILGRQASNNWALHEYLGRCLQVRKMIMNCKSVVLFKTFRILSNLKNNVFAIRWNCVFFFTTIQSNKNQTKHYFYIFSICFFRKQAIYDKAEELYREALEINRKAFGELHPQVAESLDGLG